MTFQPRPGPASSAPPTPADADSAPEKHKRRHHRQHAKPMPGAPAATLPASATSQGVTNSKDTISDAFRPGSAEKFQPAPGGPRFRLLHPRGRGRRPARPQRRRQDHLLLHGGRPDPGRCRLHPPGQARHHRPADARARAPGHRLPAAGALGVPPPQRGRQHHGRAGTARGPGRAAARPATGRLAGRAEDRPHRRPEGHQPVRRRAPPRGDRPRAGRRAALHAAGRTVCRRRSRSRWARSSASCATSRTAASAC